MNNDTPFTTIGDEPVEARIVAWVLGEASPFEVAELERLCAERPELMIFKRRMTALHGLLAEAENPQADGTWKIPAEKRGEFEAILGVGKPIIIEAAREKRIRHSGRRALLAIAACLALAFVIMHFQPWKKTSEAIIEVRPLAHGMSPLGGSMGESSGTGGATPQFFATEFEKIKSGNTLGKVVDNLDLASRWDMDKEQAVEKLKDRINTSNVRDTDLIKIQVRHSNKKDADEIARELAYAYKDYRQELEQLNAERQLAELDKAVRDQEDKVEERRKVLASIVRNKGIIYKGDDSIEASDGAMAMRDERREEAIKRGLDAQDYVDAKREFETEQRLLQQMKLKQIGESISRKIPSDSVVIHEAPGKDTKSAERASDLLASNTRTQPLRTELPAALIEGTPQPMNVPNLERPVDGPAGSETWRLAENWRQSPFTKRPSEPSGETGEILGGATLEAAPAPARPAAPASSAARVAASPASSARTPEGESDMTALAVRDAARSGAAPSDGFFNDQTVSGARTRGQDVGLVGRDYFDTSRIADGELAGRINYELQAGYSSNYIFRGVAQEQLSESALLPSFDAIPQVGGLFLDADGDTSVTRAEELRRTGRYDEARQELQRALAENPGDRQAGDAMARLDDPLRTNPALTDEHIRNVDEVRRGLYTAEGNFNLGKFDDAKREYENVLRKDPHNQAARRGMERVAAARSDYYRAAYDHTRSELLAQVDMAWELSVPAEETEFDGFINHGSPIGETDAMLPDDAKALAQAVREQETKVEERRKVLATIARTKQIIYKGQDSFYNQDGVNDDLGARSALQVQHKLEQEKLQLKSQIDSLTKYDSEQLMVYASGLNLPDNKVRELYPQYLEAIRQKDALKSKFRDNHPLVEKTASQAEAIRSQLDESVVNLRSTLQAQLDLATARLKEVQAMKDQTRGEAIKRGLDAREYEDAKKEFEKDQMLLQQMKLKLMAATMKAKLEAPKVDLTQVMEEVAASEEPYSTFSLNISDASFRIAQAALAKGEQPDPAGIKVEQFYNAVDYGDPAPAAGEPVSGTIEQAAHPVIPGRNLVRIALKTAAAGRSAAQPLRLTLLVDQSGSMTRADRRAAMEHAITGLESLLTENDKVNVIGFSRTSRLLADGLRGDQARLNDLIHQAAAEGGTNLEQAILLAEQLATRHQDAGAQNRIVLFTDGAVNLGDADPQRLAVKVEQLRQQGISFDIAGIAADDLNDALLGELARHGNGRYYVVGKGGDEDFAAKLAGAFHPAAENVKVQVRFNPERVGHYKLIGFEKDRLKTEDFRNDAVDAAELAAEEAGVAIYQVEPNPDGRGELGEVSVRFRDTASGEMVERSWTIPYDPAAPAIDRATPSMQLAVLAMFAAEKLSGGPLGEAIDFRQFAEPQADVRRFYQNDRRVAEVLHMVEMLK